MSDPSKSNPRPVYYNYAHLVLPELFFRDANNFSLSMKDQGEDFLRYLWHQVERYEKEKLTDVVDEITLTNYEEDATHIAVVCLPSPKEPTEAYFVGTVYNPIAGIIRYFTLEFTFATDGQPATMFGEWDGSRHLNYGYGGIAAVESFYQAIQEQLKKETASE